MKVELTEHDTYFEVYLTAENQQDAAKLVRQGTNCTRNLRWADTAVYPSGEVHTDLMIGRSSRSDNTVVNRNRKRG